MARRIKRNQHFEVQIQLKNDDFLRTPRADQRNWTLNRIAKEAAEELLALDARAAQFKQGGAPLSLHDRTLIELAPDEIMEDWQVPIMQAMADAVTTSHGDVLEIGYGRGIASRMIQAGDVRSHTIVDCNPHILEDCRSWRNQLAGAQIHVLEGLWQDLEEQFSLYDGILFHAYPLNEQDFAEQVAANATFAGNFFPVAAQHLKPGGCFTYFSNEADSLSRAHQRLLLQHFSSFSIHQVRELSIPDDTKDSHWLDEMLIVQAFK